MRHQRKHRPLLSQINVVPYIDVMLVLLVIFMITAPLLTQGVDVNLPQAKTRAIALKHELPIIVSIDNNGHYFINVSPTPDIPVTQQQLMDLVAAHLVIAQQSHTMRPVYVKGDTSVNYGKVMEIMATLQAAGAKHIGLLTQPLGNNTHEV